MFSFFKPEAEHFNLAASWRVHNLNQQSWVASATETPNSLYNQCKCGRKASGTAGLLKKAPQVIGTNIHFVLWSTDVLQSLS